MITDPQTGRDLCHAGPTTTILIADDHAVVRAGLRMLLEEEDGFHVVAEAGDVQETVHRVRAALGMAVVCECDCHGSRTLWRAVCIGTGSPRKLAA